MHVLVSRVQVLTVPMLTDFIIQVDFKTDKFESKVFIKDKTLPTGYISDEEEYLNSSEIGNSDTDFIVDDIDIPQTPGSNKLPYYSQHIQARYDRSVIVLYSVEPIEN